MKKAEATAGPPLAQGLPAPPIHAAPEPATANQPEALDSNASGDQSLVPDNAVAGEYLDPVDPGKPGERKVEPISQSILVNPATTMERLHEMSQHELSVLDALHNEGRQRIKIRLMAIWDEMAARFERGESINGISGTGGKGMGKYLRSVGVNPAKRRSWKFEIRREESLRLAQESPPPKCARKKKEIMINTESEADLIAKAGIKMAQVLVGDSAAPPEERVSQAGALAKDVLEAIEGGHYEQLGAGESTAQIQDSAALKLLEQEQAELQKQLELAKEENTSLLRRLKALQSIPENINDDQITASLAAEPDIFQASDLLRIYFNTVGQRVLPPNVTLGVINVEVRILGRNSRIMPGDWLQTQDSDTTVSSLCKCVGIGEFMQRRRVQQWADDKWGKEQVVYNSEQSRYRVITEEKARQLAPAAFEAPTKATPNTESSGSAALPEKGAQPERSNDGGQKQEK